MDHLTLNNDDIKACLELACDGINLHLHDQNKLDVIHKIIYAVADTMKNNQGLETQFETFQTYQLSIRVQVHPNSRSKAR